MSTIESNVPKVLTSAHVGLRVLYRLPNQLVVSEGVVEALSPESLYVRIGKRWVENGSGAVLAVLGGTRRKDALESGR